LGTDENPPDSPQRRREHREDFLFVVLLRENTMNKP
jgi:hypothetical protein